LFTCTSKNILLLSGFILSVCLGPDEHLQVSEWPGISVVSDKLRSSFFTTWGSYHIFDNK